MLTLTQAQTILDQYIAAETAVLEGKEISFATGGSDRRWRSEDLAEIRKGRQEWQNTVNSLTARTTATPTFGGTGYSLARFN